MEKKTKRATAKASVTRTVNSIRRYIAEEDKDIVVELIAQLKDKFKVFEAAHVDFHAELTEAEEIEASDMYLYDVQNSYIECLTSTKSWMHQEDKRLKEEQLSTTSSSSFSHKEFLAYVNLPKLELDKFSGDPLMYHSFCATFDENVGDVCDDGAAKLSRLLQFTDGAAKKAIRSCSIIGGNEGYTQAREILLSRFGNPHLIAQKVIESITDQKPVKGAKELMQLSNDLLNAHSTLKKMDKLSEVENQTNIADIVKRMQPYIRNRWRRLAMEQKRNKDSYPTFQTLVEFVCQEADEASDPIYGQSQFNAQSPSPSDSKPKKSAFNSSAASNQDRKHLDPCVVCGESHRLFYCNAFKSLKPVERLEIVKKYKLCENCLLGNHVVSNCRKQSVCSVPGCGKKHTKFVHIDVKPTSMSQTAPGSQECQSNVTNPSQGSVNQVSGQLSQVVSQSTSVNAEVYVPVVEVRVNNQTNVCALLDNASTATFCTRRLLDKLSIRGSTVDYELNTLSQSNEQKCSEVVNLSLTSTDGSECLVMSNVFVLDDIPVKSYKVNVDNLGSAGNLPIVKSVSTVDILIGQDHAQALLPLEVVRGKPGEPFAVRTLFGWCINGCPMPNERTSKHVISFFISTLPVEQCVERLWNVENDGSGCNQSMSIEDRKVLDYWDHNVKFVDEHYQLPIPFKENVKVPNNIEVAERRLFSLKKSLDKKQMFDRYDAEITKLLDKGYAERVVVSSSDNAGKIWYLPHHAVVSDKKPGKVRVVFDCASKFMGESLNDKCYQGPDLNNKLLHVLLRFREHRFAITGDIEAMYYQVRVDGDHRDVLRFLWFDEVGNIVCYRMTAHVFGGIWCSCVATYALRLAAEEFGAGDQAVIDTITKDFYVDDYLKSVDSADMAIDLIDKVRFVLGQGGFRLTKFVVNEDSVLQNIPEADRANEIKDLKSDIKTKALGIKWDVKLDAFYFEVHLDSVENVTKRYILSTVSSMFDPLGLINPVLVTGKLLFQEATRLKLDWDDTIPHKLCMKWYNWLQSLQGIQGLLIDRCVKPVNFNDAYVELHLFSDASEKAYGCCCYVRCINKEGQIIVSLLTSRCKVAPLKTVSIPRLELQAAVMAAQMNSMLLEQLTLSVSASYFWTDSEIVLKYIYNDTRRFQVFVANRVSAIREVSEPEQWNHISGKDNPADCLTRGQDFTQLQGSVWFTGPAFLYTYKSNWDVKSCDTNLSSDDEEVKAEKITVCATNVSDGFENPIKKLISYYSNWYKLKRAIAWLLRLKQFLKTKVASHLNNLTVREIHDAELVILKHVQADVYFKELKDLSSEGKVSKSSSLKYLLPVLDNNGLIVIGGRLKHANIDLSCKHQTILPSSHPVATLIVREKHDIAHLGTEWTLSLIRKRFWITKARSLLKFVRRKCITCRKLFDKPCEQKMADLPSDRLDFTKRPFSYVGIDCFGPYLVKYGRAEVKRYGLIVTCFTSRAVHIEKLDSLETDSFLNGFRRFIARRGQPLKVYSDCATNFVGGKNELKRCLDELKEKKIQDYFLKNEIEWVFNVPTASHMGGVWERLVGVFKRVFSGLLKVRRLTDEILQTLFSEVESIMNSRPMTKASDNVDDLSALSPNHLLIMNDGVAPPFGVFSRGDMYRKRWRYVQYLCDQFWRHWLKAYLPELQKRNKWLENRRNVEKGDLVLLVDENTPRNLWPLGIVLEVTEGRDGLVRSVRIKTQSTVLTRPVTKVVMLEEHC